MNFSQNGTKPIATETIDECLLRLHNPYVAQYEIIRGKEKSAGGVCGLAFFALYICPIIIGIWRWLSISGSFTQGLISAAITAACLLTIAGIISKAEKRYRLEANSIFGKWEREAIDVITNHRKKFGGVDNRINRQLNVVIQHY
jgi:hypothetical protein